MKNIAALYDAAAGRKVSAECGAGAAGGMGAMLSALLGAELTHGSAAVLNAVGFDALLGDTDLVITGEGQLDASSADNGKAVGEVVKRCAANSGGAVPVFIVAGRLGRGYEHIYELANAGVFQQLLRMNSRMRTETVMLRRVCALLWNECSAASQVLFREFAAQRARNAAIKQLLAQTTKRVSQ